MHTLGSFGQMRNTFTIAHRILTQISRYLDFLHAYSRCKDMKVMANDCVQSPFENIQTPCIPGNIKVNKEHYLEALVSFICLRHISPVILTFGG